MNLGNVISYYAQLHPELGSIPFPWIWPFSGTLSTNTCTQGYNTYSKTNENGPEALTQMVKHEMTSLLIEKSTMKLLMGNNSTQGYNIYIVF